MALSDVGNGTGLPDSSSEHPNDNGMLPGKGRHPTILSVEVPDDVSNAMYALALSLKEFDPRLTIELDDLCARAVRALESISDSLATIARRPA